MLILIHIWDGQGSFGESYIVPLGTDLELLPHVEGCSMYIEPVVFEDRATLDRYVAEELGWEDGTVKTLPSFRE